MNSIGDAREWQESEDGRLHSVGSWFGKARVFLKFGIDQEFALHRREVVSTSLYIDAKRSGSSTAALRNE